MVPSVEFLKSTFANATGSPDSSTTIPLTFVCAAEKQKQQNKINVKIDFMNIVMDNLTANNVPIKKLPQPWSTKLRYFYKSILLFI